MKIWLHGLVAALISGSASAIVVALVEPRLLHEPIKLLEIVGAGGLTSAAAYLKKSPLPSDERPPE